MMQHAVERRSIFVPNFMLDGAPVSRLFKFNQKEEKTINIALVIRLSKSLRARVVMNILPKYNYTIF